MATSFKDFVKQNATGMNLAGAALGNIGDLTDAAKTGREVSLETRVAYRFDSAQVVDKVSASVDELFLCMGGSAIFDSNPIQGFFLDIHTARGHYANNPERPGINYGGVLLEQRTTDYFL